MSRKTVTTISIILLVILVGMFWLFMESQASIYQAEDEAVAIVEVDYPVKQVNEFYWVTFDETFFSLDFFDNQEVQRYAIISQEGGDTDYYTYDELISEPQAKELTLANMGEVDIIQARLGKLANNPVWEITLRNANGTLTYYYLNAVNGTWVQTIENI
ncbi:hypothetical protein [Fundicoccus culcitae]|uniref:DUF5590 domain-containing protein n=1 Tax=Fundicoccus culcitae TaxID=2969821 RepID=A0ABY5P7V4_9LACT|nr:hypothetical protein [Fundicoccus culcitae]UUX34533.1 hypothetical protein NRE15_02460 [Fundicoccus culcitae]